ncbi:tRNA uridine-5-carboxymethylaminomethyl(34) synthesis GTPase MnmE [Fusibacter ferrireducens]|uniref:tRNA modification GTPase MnmE n=1 Tax=Fusibacter ferrireducens TaxID=2785058 RepID=A0ABR9ZY93_9FIRM|nr:tRNA uridine-5-carboxymethylaminomethyl(34) synthesis GTPase MnmE [Fusibacter ferrireducens]MBF4695441.1 tRNA uridine-5-carboxymethylaminomethyl(34) synthesis GTPase MnmE [Fusibacter ferrireducens]
MLFDTITAISTPLGEGAIGIVRMSGPDSFQILSEIFKPFKKSNDVLENRKMYYGHIFNNAKMIDEVMVVKLPSSGSYTMEDVVEINCHGGMMPLREILALILSKGARMADKGEFTKRAFLNGRIDLAQAESVMDLISAKTEIGFDVAMHQLKGHLSEKITQYRDNLIGLMAEIEVSIDYPEEDIEEITYSKIESTLANIKNHLNDILEKSKSGKIIREGLKTVIVGKPNVGKSSLMNALLKDSRAIVTEIPGTTRDVIEEYMNISGIPIKLMDTAGIRDTEDLVEKIGVQKSKFYFNEADLIIFVLDASVALTKEDHEIMSLVKNKHAIVIINKTDLESKIDMNAIHSVLMDKTIIKASIQNELGIEALENEIKNMVFGNEVEVNYTDIMSNARHIQLVKDAEKNISDALNAVHSGMPYDFIEVDVKNAILNLGHITGESVEEDLMNTIFSNFCLGK